MNRTKKVSVVIALMLLLSLAINGTLAWLKDETKPVQNTFTLGKVKIKLDEAVVGENGQKVSPEQRTGITDISGNAYHVVPGTWYDKDPTVTVLADSEPCYVRMFVKIQLPEGKDIKRDLGVPGKEFVEGYIADTNNFREIMALATNGYFTVDPSSRTVSLTDDNKAKILNSCIEGWEEENWTRVGQWVAGTLNPLTGIISRDGNAVIIEYRYNKNGGIVEASDTDTALPALFTQFCLPGDLPTSVLEKARELLGEEMPTVSFIAQAIQAENLHNAEDAWDAAGVPAGYEHEAAPISLELPDIEIPMPTTP